MQDMSSEHSTAKWRSWNVVSPLSRLSYVWQDQFHYKHPRPANLGLLPTATNSWYGPAQASALVKMERNGYNSPPRYDGRWAEDWLHCSAPPRHNFLSFPLMTSYKMCKIIDAVIIIGQRRIYTFNIIFSSSWSHHDGRRSHRLFLDPFRFFLVWTARSR